MCSLPVPRGLVNLGNTCYFNSIMQVLLNAPLFGNLLEERTSTSDNKYTLEDPVRGEAIEVELPECDYAVRSLVELYKQYMNQPKRPGSSNNIASNLQPISPNKLMNNIRQKTGRFQRLVQEDSHELLRSLIDIIRSDEIRRQKEAISSCIGGDKSSIKADIFTLIDMIFGGYFLSSVKCQKCKHKSQHLEPFYDISLAISDPISDIRSAIAKFTSNAILDGDNKVICERCSKENGKKSYEAGVKSTNITVPPNILTLHLKRFEASGEMRGGLGGGRKSNGKSKGGGGGGGRRAKTKGGKGADGDDSDDLFGASGGGLFRKINKHVEFTEFLDLSDFTSDLCYDLTKINRWPRINRGDPIWYSIFGVVCHSGNLRGGHYTAYVKSEDPVDENCCLDDFADFIKKTPYLNEFADLDKLREHIKQHDSTRCETTDKYRDDEDTHSAHYHNGDADDYDKPKSIPGNWYHISDSQVRKSNLAGVLSSQAYILFYRRVIE